MKKEMNWLYVKENYGKIFEETFGKESVVLDIINIDYSIAKEKSQKELLEYIRRIECEMRFLVDCFKTNPTVATKLSNWCLNMNQNLMYCIDNKTK